MGSLINFIFCIFSFCLLKRNYPDLWILYNLEFNKTFNFVYLFLLELTEDFYQFLQYLIWFYHFHKFIQLINLFFLKWINFLDEFPHLYEKFLIPLINFIYLFLHEFSRIFHKFLQQLINFLRLFLH